MKIKIALIFLFVSLFVPFAFCQEDKNDLKAGADIAVTKVMDASSIINISGHVRDLTGGVITAAYEKVRVFITSKNAMSSLEKKAQLGARLIVAGVTIMLLGVIALCVLFIFNRQGSKAHNKEFAGTKIEKPQDRKIRGMESNNLKPRAGGQQKEFDELQTGAEMQKAAEYGRIMSFVYSYINEQQYNEALAELEKAVRLMPANSEAWFQKGYIAQHQNKNQLAVDMYDKAIKLNPDNAEAYNNKGNALCVLGKYQAALNMYDKAFEKYNIGTNAKSNLGLAAVYNNNGNVLQFLNKHQQALNMYDESIRLNPDIVQAYNNKGIALHALARYEEAVKMYEKAIELNADKTEKYYSLAEAYLFNGNIEKAFAAFKKYIESAQDSYLYDDDYKVWSEMLAETIKTGTETEAAANMKAYLEENIKSKKLILEGSKQETAAVLPQKEAELI